MRRPSPLPTPVAPALAPAAGKPRGRRERVEPVAEDAPLDDAPLGDARLHDAPRAEASDTTNAAMADLLTPRETAPDPETDRVGVRDVWRAARARRKALRAEVRRFTQRQRRRRAVWIGAIGSVVLLVALTFAAAYSPLFGVERITVVGTSQLSATDVEAALAGQIGTPLALVDESAVKSALIGFPLVESYSLEARPPHDLVVRIVERTPVGVVQSPAGFTVVDAAGVALSTSATAPAGQPVLDITGGVHSAAFASAGKVIRSLPDAIRAQVTAVRASTPDDVTLTLGGTNTQVVWGSADQSAEKARTLASTMISRPPATARSYDVSSPKAVVVR